MRSLARTYVQFFPAVPCSDQLCESEMPTGGIGLPSAAVVGKAVRHQKRVVCRCRDLHGVEFAVEKRLFAVCPRR